MTDNETIKAFECCVKGVCDRARCPRYDSDEHTVAHQFCRRKTMLEALDLINRYKAEIERLKGEVAKEFICFVGNPHKVEQCPYLEELSKVRAEAIKEFAERIKEDYENYIEMTPTRIEYHKNKMVGEL